MLLKDYIPNINKKYQEIFFSGIAFDSSKVKKNYIFFAIKGNKFDGNDYIEAAIKKGAKIIVSEKKINKKKENILYFKTQNVRKLLAEVSFKIINKRPKKLVAVTGTNGKSSVADFYYQILNFNLKKVASIGTLGIRFKDKRKALTNTTLNPIQLSSILKQLKKNKVEYVIMEASSHGLKQNRLDGLLFDVGVFTNFSHDHLDYHKSMKNYLKSKLYLFEKLIKKKGNIITDTNIPEIKKIKNISFKMKTNLSLIFNEKKGIKLISHRYLDEKQIVEIKFENKKYNLKLNLIGKIQIKNVLMAILAANKSGLKFEKIIKVINKIKPVEGRLEKIGNIKNNSKVILDYAHTPEALELALLNLKEQFPTSRISLVFGCGGNRDLKKRYIMGRVAEEYSNKVYLTDDNPRNEKPSKIRKDIKKGIKQAIIHEIPNRKKAIFQSIKALNTGDVLLIAGKGHEKIQDYGRRKLFFSDQEEILKSIKSKNKFLSKNLKLNIIKEESKSKISEKLIIKNISINSKTIKKNDIFFAIKGQKSDGNKFVEQSLKKKASMAIVNKIQKNLNNKRQIKVRDTLKFLTDTSKIFRKNINTKIIGITGSCGKTTLKELLGNSLKKFSKVSISPKSYNNKYGVPLSLFNLRQNDNYGILEVGMDKKGEIDNLSKIIQPDVSVITNVNYAHAKNFNSIEDIALAKSEIINNTKRNGFIVLNADDNFFKFHQKIAFKNNLKVISFGIKNQKADVKFIGIHKKHKNFEICIKINTLKKYFLISSDFKNNIYNTLASLAVMSIYTNIFLLKNNIFLNFKIPQGRGDFSKVRINKKNINLIDESYNSNPLSLKSAILNYDKIETKKSKKYLLLGDMLDLGSHSKKLHQSIAPIINQTKVDKVFVKGSEATFIFEKLSKSKKGRIFHNKSQIIELIRNDLDNNDYLMIKASNATGFNEIVKNLKGLN